MSDIAGTPSKLYQVLMKFLKIDPELLREECIFRKYFSFTSCENFLNTRFSRGIIKMNPPFSPWELWAPIIAEMILDGRNIICLMTEDKVANSPVSKFLRFDLFDRTDPEKVAFKGHSRELVYPVTWVSFV